MKTNTVPPKTYSLGKPNVLHSVITKQEGMNTRTKNSVQEAMKWNTQQTRDKSR